MAWWSHYNANYYAVVIMIIIRYPMHDATGANVIVSINFSRALHTRPHSIPFLTIRKNFLHALSYFICTSYSFSNVIDVIAMLPCPESLDTAKPHRCPAQRRDPLFRSC